jgi:hypothetical protein
MAQDAREVRVQPPDSSLLPDDPLMEKSSAAEWTSAPSNRFPDWQNNNSPSMNPLHTESKDKATALSPVLSDRVEDNSEAIPTWGSKLRTLPGK